MLQLGGMLNKLMQFKCIIDGGLGAKLPVAGQFLQFLEKIAILPSFRSRFERFLGHRKEQSC